MITELLKNMVRVQVTHVLIINIWVAVEDVSDKTNLMFNLIQPHCTQD